MNKSLVEKARAMIHGADLGKELWGEAVLSATYLLNLTPTKAILQNKTPYELWHGKKPRLYNLKIFGSTAYILDKTKKAKFDKKSFKGILVGYEQNGYKVLNVETNKFIIARDVIFDEFNFKSSRPPVHISNNENSNSNSKRQKTDQNLEISKNEDSKNEESNINKSGTKTDEVIKMPNTGEKYQTDVKENKLRRSARIKNMSNINYNKEHSSYLCAQSIVCEIPKSYHEIENRNDKIQWEKAIKEEIDSLLKNNTWEIVPRPNNKNIVDCRWVFVIKNDIHGNLTKYKARVVAKGFSQQYLLDYDETFAPVARITSFRIIVAFANQNSLLIHHIDVKTAFLNGLLKEEIYMRVPEGIEAKEDQVCRLNRAIYGLKQSARCWFQQFDHVLKQKGSINSSVDRCLYIFDKGDVKRNIYILLYVDDLLIITLDIDTMINVKQYLMSQFSIVDMQELKFFLGINIERNGNIISLDQSSYLLSVLQKFNMSDCNAVSTPLPTKLNYEALNSEEYYDAPCKNLIGCLMY